MNRFVAAPGSGARPVPAACVAIGAFDGVHVGHQAVIAAMLARARVRGLAAQVQTFDPPPRVFFGRARRLCSHDEQLARLYALGVERVNVAKFDAAYASRPPAAFIAELKAIGAVEIHVGADFRFGKDRAGNIGMLREHFEVVTTADVVCPKGERISSTRIRGLRGGGVAGQARALLGILPSASPLPTADAYFDTEALERGPTNDGY